MRHLLLFLLASFTAFPAAFSQSEAVNELSVAAIDSLKATKFNHGNFSSPLQRFQGKLPGLVIARPGSNPNQNFQARMRGLSSFESLVTPLIVLDGMPVSDISWVDPYDLQSVALIKDATAAGRFGLQAGPGVLQLHTLPGEVERFSIGYHGQLAVEQAAERYQVLNAAQFLNYGGQDLSPTSNTDNDWQDLVLQTATSQTHRISINTPMYGSGSALSAALSYRNMEGILRESGQQQYNGSLSFRQHLWMEKIRLQGSLRAARRDANLSFPEAFRYAITFNPTAPVQSDDPQYAPYGGYVSPLLFDYFNPVAILEQNSNRSRLNAYMGTLRTEVDLLRGLTGLLQMGYEHQNQTAAAYYSPESFFRGLAGAGSVTGLALEKSNQFLDAGARYAHKMGSIGLLELSGGYSWQRYDYNATQGTASQPGNLTRNSALDALYSFAVAADSNYSQGYNTLAAVYGHGRWKFRDLLSVEFGLRREGSSRLGARNKWHLFPFGGIAADLSKAFQWDKIYQLKLRSTYGVTGQQPAYDGLSQSVFRPSGGQFYYNGSFQPGYYPFNNPNPDLSAEKTRTLNLGMDVVSGNQRIRGSFNYFRRTSSDLILALRVPAPPNIAGITYTNTGELHSNGWEASLGWQNILDKSSMRWSADLYAASSKTEITRYLGQDDIVLNGAIGAPGFGNGAYGLLYSGMPLGQFWGPIRTGVNADGELQYKDVNRDGVVDIYAFNQDQTDIGNATPTLLLGIFQTLEWRKWDLNFFLRGILGHDMAHENRVFYENLNLSLNAYNKVQTEYFNPAITDVNRFDNTHIEHASFLRLDNLTIGYSPAIKFNNRPAKLRFYLGGQNLLTFTNYSGLDPDLRLEDPGPSDNGSTGSASPNQLLPGVDRRGTYFPARTYLMGVQLQL